MQCSVGILHWEGNVPKVVSKEASSPNTPNRSLESNPQYITSESVALLYIIGLGILQAYCAGMGGCRKEEEMSARVERED